MQRKDKIYPDKIEVEKIISLIKIIENYHALHKVFPQNLKTFLKENLVRREQLLNPWGYPYIYEVTNDGKTFKLLSVGKDGFRNTDDDTDITWRE